MEKKLTLALLLVFSCSFTFLLRGQNIAPFAPIGSKWVYNFFSYAHGEGHSTMRFVKDTVIAGITCRQMSQKTIYTYCDPATFCNNFETNAYLFQRNDSLFRLIPTQIPTIELMFDYRCKVGDSLVLTKRSPTAPNVNAYISRIGDTILGGRRTKFWEMREFCNNNSLRNPLFHFEQVLNFNLGAYTYSTTALCVGNYHFSQRLCSFEGNNWTYFANYCRNATQEVAFDVRVFPNPTVENLQITSPQYFEADYKITDVQGRLVQNGSYTEGSHLDVSRLAKGLYFLALSNKHGRSVRRFVKQ